MTRVLILSASYGEGHNAAARNLSAAFNTIGGEGTSEVLDLMAEGSPRIDRVVRSVYYYVINRLPKVWSGFYNWLDRYRPFPRHIGLFHRERQLLLEHIRRANPVAICSTYPVFGFVMQKLTDETGVDVPFYNVVTDSISINSMWWLPRCRGWFLPNEESAQVLRDAGVASRMLHVMGFPVPEVFARGKIYMDPPDPKMGVRPKILYIIHSGSANVVETARLLIEKPDWEICFAVGRDDRLRQRLQSMAEGRAAPTEVLGWTDRIPHLMMTHHVVISKAGGATTQEAIAARCPMLVNQIIPGQEEGNYELLRRYDIGAYVPTAASVVQNLERAFRFHGLVWVGWRIRLEELACPHAATDIARFVLKAHGVRDPSSSHIIEPAQPSHG